MNRFSFCALVSSRRGGRIWSVPTALAAAFSSIALWSSPVSAGEPANNTLVDGACLEAPWGGYWIVDSNSDGLDVGTMTGNLEDGLELTWTVQPINGFGPTVGFFSDEDCPGAIPGLPFSIPTSFPPTNVCVVFSASGWQPELIVFRDSEEDPRSYYIDFDFVDLSQSEILPFVDEEDEPLTLGESYILSDYPGQQYGFRWDPVLDTSWTEDPTFTMTFTRCGNTRSNGGLHLDIDPQTFLNRAPAESGDLPDTL